MLQLVGIHGSLPRRRDRAIGAIGKGLSDGESADLTQVHTRLARGLRVGGNKRQLALIAVGARPQNRNAKGQALEQGAQNGVRKRRVWGGIFSHRVAPLIFALVGCTLEADGPVVTPPRQRPLRAAWGLLYGPRVNATAPDRRYFVNAPVDLLAMGGLSILAWAVLRATTSGERTDDVITLGIQLAWIVNWPHFAATSYRLYQSPEHVAQYPFTARVLPWLIGAGIGAALLLPNTFAPWWVKVFLVWSPYHFSGQTFGVTMLYARRCGWPVDASLRRALQAFIYGTFLVGTVGAETWETGSEWYGVVYPTLGLPGWTVTVATWLMYGGLVAVVVKFATVARSRRRWPPLILLIPAAAQYVWFIGGASWLTFAEFVPLFHSAQYLLIAWSMHLHEARETDGDTARPRFIAVRTARFALVNFAGGAVMFWALPHLFAEVFGFTLFFATAAVIAGVQLHHFFVDGVIWKLRRKSVRSPLLGTWPELQPGRSYTNPETSVISIECRSFDTLAPHLRGEMPAGQRGEESTAAEGVH